MFSNFMTLLFHEVAQHVECLSDHNSSSPKTCFSVPNIIVQNFSGGRRGIQLMPMAV